MKHKKKLIEDALPLDAKRSGLESHCRLLTRTVFTTVAGRASEGSISAWRAERLRVFRSCPLITPKGARSSLQMLAIAQAMPVLCA